MFGADKGTADRWTARNCTSASCRPASTKASPTRWPPPARPSWPRWAWTSPSTTCRCPARWRCRWPCRPWPRRTVRRADRAGLHHPRRNLPLRAGGQRIRRRRHPRRAGLPGAGRQRHPDHRKPGAGHRPPDRQGRDAARVAVEMANCWKIWHERRAPPHGPSAKRPVKPARQSRTGLTSHRRAQGIGQSRRAAARANLRCRRSTSTWSAATRPRPSMPSRATWPAFTRPTRCTTTRCCTAAWEAPSWTP
jgi:hypothetical protein